MLWRHLCLVRAWSAAGLLTCLFVGATALAEPDDPAPRAEPDTRTVPVLEAKRAGDLAVELRGKGQDRVRLILRNTSARRLNVVLPAGLVAASTAGQGAAGGGFQSMGLGAPDNEPGAFGAFRSAPADAASPADAGFRSIPPTEDARAGDGTVTVPAGQTVELAIPAVCLNFGLPTPTPRDRFELVDVDDYSPDPRVRKALRSLATLGTSHGVAQAAMWRVCNDVPFEFMAAQKSKVVNPHEVALASRFVAALDASGESERVDPAYLTEARILISVQGDGPLAREAQRLEGALDGLRLLGLPVRVADRNEPVAAAPALWVKVLLTDSAAGQTRGRLFLNRAVVGGDWVPLGKTTFHEGSAADVLDATTLLKALDHAIATAFVTVKPARRGTGTTTLKIDNHLPFTLANVILKAGGSAGQPKVDLNGLGVGPARSALAPIPAPGGSVDHVELNGL